MRRWVAAVGGAAAVLTLAAGCSLPEGVDGALVDDWPAAPAPQLWSPKAGDCHANATPEVTTLSEYKPVACTGRHSVETVHVGTFTGEHAARESTPPVESPAHRAAYGECVTKTTEYLGDDYRTGRVWMQVALPSGGAWSAGARWFRCDVWEYADEDEWTVELSRDGSLKDSLRGNRPLGFGCYGVTEKNDEIDKVEPVACDKPHNAEFAGIGIAKDVPYPADAKARSELLSNQCRGPVAAYAGLKNDGTLQYRIGYIFQGFGEREWKRGNRGVRCLLYLDKNVTKLMKGAGPAAFPAN